MVPRPRRARGAGPRRGIPLFQQNPSEQTARLGEIALERHRPLGVAPRVGQPIVLLVQPPQVDVGGGIPVRPRERVRERPPRAVAIAEGQAADADVHRELRQRGVQRRRHREGFERFLVPVLALQHDPSQLVPQRLAFGCLGQTLGDRVRARVAAPRVDAAEREQHGRLVRRRVGARLQVRNRLGVAAKLDEDQAEQLARLQQRGIGGMHALQRLDGGSQRPGAVVRDPQVHPRGVEPRVDRQRALVGSDRLFVAAETREHRAEICVRFGEARIDLDRAPVRLDRALEVSALLRRRGVAERGCRRTLLNSSPACGCRAGLQASQLRADLKVGTAHDQDEA